jgi:hypothetical protein
VKKTTVELIKSREIRLILKATGQIAYVNPDDWTQGGYHITNTKGQREWVSDESLNRNYEVA